MRTPIVLTALTALAVAACGSDSTDSQELPDTQLPDADELVEEAEELGISPLALALDQTADATAFQVEMAMGMVMDLGGMPGSVTLEADLATPLMAMQSDAEGQQYTIVDMGPMLDATMESSGVDASEMFGGDLTMETWVDATTLYVDLGGFGDMMAMSGSAFPADRFSVDLVRLGEIVGDAVGGADVASALSGQAAPDPVEMAEVLGEVLTDANGDGTTYSGTISFVDYARAFGQDPDAMLGGGAAGFDDLMGAGSAEAMLDVFERIEPEVAVSIVDGAVDTIRFDVDLAPMMEAMTDLMGEAGVEIPDDERAEVEAMFADMVFEMTMLLDYDIDPTIDVTVPDGDFPDATGDFESLFGMALGA